MKIITSYLRLFRIQNLLIIGILMYFVRFFLIQPVYEIERLSLQTDSFSFFLFVFGYILLAAGGYAINDYYDIGMDEINRPEKTVLRKEIPLSHGKYAYFISTFFGVIISVWAILRIGTPKLVFVLAIVTMLYWFYTTKYKREFLTGNLAVSILAALAAGIVWLYEFFASIHYGILPLNGYKFITRVILSYAGFAFLLTFVREIIKDIADMNGDNEFNCRTIPIVLGIRKSVLIVYTILIIIFTGMALSAYYFFINSYIYMLSFSAIIGILLIFFIFKLSKATEKKDYLFLSDLLKIIFLAGIISLQLFSLELQ